MSYKTYYKVTDKNGKILIDHSVERGPSVCFQKYNLSYYTHVYNGQNEIEVYFLKKYPVQSKNEPYAENIFSDEQIKSYINVLNNAGFPIKITEGDKYYTFSFNESQYINHTHIRIALDYLRCLWEGGINKILVDFLNIPTDIRLTFDEFELFQICSIRKGSISNTHRVPSQSTVDRMKFSILTKNEILAELKNSEKISSFEFWGKLRARKLREYNSKIINRIVLDRIKEDKVGKLLAISLDSHSSVVRAYQICNPKTRSEISREKKQIIKNNE